MFNLMDLQSIQNPPTWIIEIYLHLIKNWLDKQLQKNTAGHIFHSCFDLEFRGKRFYTYLQIGIFTPAFFCLTEIKKYKDKTHSLNFTDLPLILGTFRINLLTSLNVALHGAFYITIITLHFIAKIKSTITSMQ